MHVTEYYPIQLLIEFQNLILAIVSNTVEIISRFENKDISKIEIIDVSKICAAAIERSLLGQSLSELMVL